MCETRVQQDWDSSLSPRTRVLVSALKFFNVAATCCLGKLESNLQLRRLLSQV
jgi:hypothetical protein